MTPSNQTILNEISIDCIIFGFNNGILEVLLVKHAIGNSIGEWGLPGGFINEKEGIDAAAHRLLLELTGLDNIFLEQIKAFGNPKRIPTNRVITIGYYALINREEYDVKAGLTVSEAKWYKIDSIPHLIYDHNEILDFGLKKLQTRILKAPIGFNLLPEKFTLLQLMHLYEEILGKELDKSNFRRKILKMKLLVALDEKQQDVSHRAAQLYQFDSKIYAKLSQKGFNFEL
nr:NUDIX domain-containing protein [uncultured Flavobacterium sp.]